MSVENLNYGVTLHLTEVTATIDIVGRETCIGDVSHSIRHLIALHSLTLEVCTERCWQSIGFGVRGALRTSRSRSTECHLNITIDVRVATITTTVDITSLLGSLIGSSYLINIQSVHDVGLHVNLDITIDGTTLEATTIDITTSIGVITV